MDDIKKKKKHKKKKSKKKRACTNCGAELTYLPGTDTISCQYCGHKEQIKVDKIAIKEIKLKKYLKKIGEKAHSEEVTMIQCKECGANQSIEENIKSLKCVYCSSPLLVSDSKKEEWILPGAVAPFQIGPKKCHQIFVKWVKSLWFAPNKLHKMALDAGNLKGLYLPYWTFDAQVEAEYEGMRGDYYYVDVPYTTIDEDGDTVTEERTERRIEWSYTSGFVEGFIDDILIKASHQKKNPIPNSVSNWNLNSLQPFNNDFLTGFITEKYTVSLKDGHSSAIKEVQNIVRRWAREDIGGDQQQVSSIDVELSEETFKHILLPIYMSVYKYNGKQYTFYVNGQTGQIGGKRPYSFWKIAFLILGILAFILLIVIILN